MTRFGFIPTFILSLCVLLLSGSVTTAAQWHMINVNHGAQGDAHLLVDNGINVMIDAGDYKQAKSYLVPYLQKLNITRINHFFVSHPHTDHYQGIDALTEAGIKISNIYFNLPPFEDWNFKQPDFLATIERTSAIQTEASKGLVLNLPNTKLTILHANKARKINGRNTTINDYSLIMAWDSNGYRTLFTGDLDLTVGQELAKNKHQYKADILKIPHHGVTPIAPNNFFKTVSPNFAMFASAKVLWNDMRGQQARNWVLSENTHYCHNGLNGNIIIQPETARLLIQSERPTPSCPSGYLSIPPNRTLHSNLAPIINLLAE